MTKTEFKGFMDILIRLYNEDHEAEFYTVVVKKAPAPEHHEALVVATPNRCPIHIVIASASLATTAARELTNLIMEAATERHRAELEELLRMMPPPTTDEKGS